MLYVMCNWRLSTVRPNMYRCSHTLLVRTAQHNFVDNIISIAQQHQTYITDSMRIQGGDCTMHSLSSHQRRIYDVNFNEKKNYVLLLKMHFALGCQVGRLECKCYMWSEKGLAPYIAKARACCNNERDNYFCAKPKCVPLSAKPLSGFS